MYDTLNDFENRFKQMGAPELLVLGAAGLATLLFGYRIKKIAFFIIWFLIGYNLMLLLMPFINQNAPEVAASQLYQILIPIGGGAVLALLGFSIEKLCVAGICFALVMMITVQYFGTEIPVLAVGAILGLVAGAAGTAMLKPAIILATAIAGGWVLTIVLLSLFPEINREIFYFPSIAIISAIGTFFQFKTTKRIA